MQLELESRTVKQERVGNVEQEPETRVYSATAREKGCVPRESRECAARARDQGMYSKN